MRAKPKQRLKDVRKKRERMLARERKEYQDYINEVAQHAITNDELHAAIIRAFANSDRAMSSLAKSDEAMANLAKCDEAMAKLAKCDGAINA
jgi:hypothetical protein